MAKLGYLRVSTQEQRPDRQIDGLAGICDELFVEQASAASMKRPVFEQVLAKLDAGDALVVWDLDRAFRSTIDAIQTAEILKSKGIELNIVNLNVDTATPAGMLVYTVLSACAEFERRIIGQRTREGMQAAKARGVKIGRPPKLTRRQLRLAASRIESGEMTVRQIADDFGIAPWSLTRAIKRNDGRNS